METTLTSNFPHKRGVSNGVLGMIFLLTTEAMFFAGLISAYIVNRSAVMEWPPVNQPRLPIEVTAVNTLFLILSAVSFYLFTRRFKLSGNTTAALKFLVITILFGVNFLFIQGTEWIKLLDYGLSSTSSLYGAFFYLIIGAHALHVIAGVVILFYLVFSLKRSVAIEVSKNKITVCGIYWYFVVGIWPMLYYLVYLM